MTPGETLGTLYTSGVGTELDSVLGASDEDSERSSEDSSAEEFRQAEERGAAHDIAGELDYYVTEYAEQGYLDSSSPEAWGLTELDFAVQALERNLIPDDTGSTYSNWGRTCKAHGLKLQGHKSCKDLGAVKLGRALVRSHSQAFVTLNLVGCGIGWAGAAALSVGVARNEYLTALNLSRNRIEDEGATSLSW